MTATPEIRGWKALALFATVFALLLLLLPNAADHHASVLCLLVPILLIIEPVVLRVPHGPKPDRVVPPDSHVRSTLFQRPPPSQA